MISRRSFTVGAVSLLGVVPGRGEARYPARPIKFINGFTVGSSADVVCRQVCEKAGEFLGQRIVMENRGGAGGVTGATALARSDPDGYTIGLGSNISHAGVRFLQKSVPYDTVRDFEPIALMATVPCGLIVNAKLKVATVEEFVDLLKSNPGKYSYGHTGRGVTAHLAGEVFRRSANVDVVGVPYPGGQAVTDLLSGVTQFMFYATTPLKGSIDSGDLRMLATIHTERLPTFYPELPTMIEKGYPNLAFYSWLAAFAPARTAPEIVAKLSEAFRFALNDRRVSELMMLTGSIPSYLSPESLRQMQSSEIARFKNVVEIAGLIAE